jgi:hypothetical protein
MRRAGLGGLQVTTLELETLIYHLGVAPEAR